MGWTRERIGFRVAIAFATTSRSDAPTRPPRLECRNPPPAIGGPRPAECEIGLQAVHPFRTDATRREAGRVEALPHRRSHRPREPRGEPHPAACGRRDRRSTHPASVRGSSARPRGSHVRRSSPAAPGSQGGGLHAPRRFRRRPRHVRGAHRPHHPRRTPDSSPPSAHPFGWTRSRELQRFDGEGRIAN
jgi:hypothetical protein